MKLFNAKASPFGRKVMLTAHELGLIDRITFEEATAHPINHNQDMVAMNPTGKIPCLLIDNDEPLFDSRVICEYLDHIGGNKLFPRDNSRWAALRMLSAADEAGGAALLARYEGFVRPENLRWADWQAGQMRKIDYTLAHFERTIGEFSGAVHIGHLAVASLCGYLNFRFAEHNWQATNPQLAAWYAAFSQRPSMLATRPD
jgi:glutathione S-transferase